MAENGIPHFHNSGGFPAITIGAREFKCIGALPPHDHPHVYIDMGDDSEIVCPYCSTHFRYDEKLAAGTADPAECLYQGS